MTDHFVRYFGTYHCGMQLGSETGITVPSCNRETDQHPSTESYPSSHCVSLRHSDMLVQVHAVLELRTELAALII